MNSTQNLLSKYRQLKEKIAESNKQFSFVEPELLAELEMVDQQLKEKSE